MKRLTYYATGLAAALMMAAPVTGAQAQKVETVRLAMLAPSALLWLHAIAEDKGFYSARNIKIEELRAASSPALLQAVTSGSVEAGISLSDLVIRAVDQGAPVVITGAILQKTSLRMIGGTGITDIKQLAGEPVTAGAVEGGTANLLRYQLKQGGVDERGVKMVSITNSRDRVVALANGQVKGALLIAPFDTIAIRDGMKVLDIYREPYLQTPLVVNTTWAAANPETARNLTQALQEASNWIYDPANKDEAVRILASYTNADPEICVDSYAFLIEDQQAIGRNLEVTAEALENIIKIDQAVATSPASDKEFDLSRYYDPSFRAN